MKKTNPVGFANIAVQKRKVKTEFFDQINKVVDWRPISNIINEQYIKGNSATGSPAYAVINAVLLPLQSRFKYPLGPIAQVYKSSDLSSDLRAKKSPG